MKSRMGEHATHLLTYVIIYSQFKFSCLSKYRWWRDLFFKCLFTYFVFIFKFNADIFCSWQNNTLFQNIMPILTAILFQCLNGN